MDAFPRLRRLPPYPFAELNELKQRLRERGSDLIDFGMANPDGAPPAHAVESLVQAAADPRQHRYSSSRGIQRLRSALAGWYARHYEVYLDPENECVVTMGSKDGLVHGLLAFTEPGDTVMLLNPCYPIHRYAALLAGCTAVEVPVGAAHENGTETLARIERVCASMWPRPRLLLLDFPNNPTGVTVDLHFFEGVVRLARQYGFLVIHDFAHAELGFDGYRPPSFLAARGAREVGVELTTLSKGYNLPGWRVGFVAGNRGMVRALARVKSFLDYGIFQPLQIAAAGVLEAEGAAARDVAATYHARRDRLVAGFQRLGWAVEAPKAGMFVWARIPERFAPLDSHEFARKLLTECAIAVSPGAGFGSAGEGYLRFALVESESRIDEAVARMQKWLSGTWPGL